MWSKLNLICRSTLVISACLQIFNMADAKPKAKAASGAPIVLGQSAPFTGPSAHLGQQPWLGAQTYVDEVNRHGGIDGRPVKIVALDDAYDPEKTEKNTKELIANPELFALFNYVGTPTLLKALPLVQESRKANSDLFLFGNRTGAKQQRSAPLNEFVFNMRASYAEEGEALVKYFTDKANTKFAIYIQDDAYGESGKSAVQEALQRRKLSLLAEARYKRGAQVPESTTTQVETLLKAKPEVIVSIASYRAATGFIRDARMAGFTGPIVNISFVGAQDMLNSVKAEEERLHKSFSDKLFVSQVLPALSETKNPLVAEYLKLSHDHPVTPPAEIANGEEIKKVSISGMEGFLNAKIFVEICKRAKKPLTRKSFLEAANADFKIDLGFSQPFHFSAQEHQGSHDVWMTEVVHGEFQNSL